MHRSHGFTLIEMVVVMLIISGGLIGLTSLFSNTAHSLTTNELMQQATQYAQECAERLMATRRHNKFDWFVSNTFSCGGNPSDFTFASTVSAIYSGDTTTACPNLANCRDVSISVTSTANASLNSVINLLLVEY